MICYALPVITITYLQPLEQHVINLVSFVKLKIIKKNFNLIVFILFVGCEYIPRINDNLDRWYTDTKGHGISTNQSSQF